MRLRGARVATSATSAERVDLEIRGERLHFCSSNGHGLDLTGFLLLPGLINAHDHLEFSLFPKLGARLYTNATEWARDIYRPEESPVREHRAVPKAVRLIWGGIRNLVSGVTTVSHHNPYEAAVFGNTFPVRVVREFDWAHSLAFDPDLKDRFHKRVPGRPFIVHAAEGVDACARAEIARLESLGVLTGDTVLVHAFGIGPEDIDLLLRRRCSIVWCPRSNLATYGETLSPDILASGIPVALGTDSPITAGGDLRDAIRSAKADPERVYRMVTTEAARILQLRDGQGGIRDGGIADLVAVADHGETPAEAIFDLQPDLVIVGGHLKLASQRLASAAPAHFQSMSLESQGPLLIDADLRTLYDQAAAHIGPDCRPGGRKVSV